MIFTAYTENPPLPRAPNYNNSQETYNVVQKIKQILFSGIFHLSIITVFQNPEISLSNRR